jgi:hypothetical protein
MVESLIFVILGVMIVNPTTIPNGSMSSFWDNWNTLFSFTALALVVLARFAGKHM